MWRVGYGLCNAKVGTDVSMMNWTLDQKGDRNRNSHGMGYRRHTVQRRIVITPRLCRRLVLAGHAFIFLGTGVVGRRPWVPQLPPRVLVPVPLPCLWGWGTIHQGVGI